MTRNLTDSTAAVVAMLAILALGVLVPIASLLISAFIAVTAAARDAEVRRPDPKRR